MNKIANLSITRGFQIFQLFRFSALLLTGILLSKSNIEIEEIGVYEGLIFISGAVSFFWVNGILNGLLSQYKKEEANKNVKDDSTNDFCTCMAPCRMICGILHNIKTIRYFFHLVEIAN